MRRALFIVALMVGVGSFGSIHLLAERQHGDHRTYQPNDIEWQDGPESLPPGVQYVILDGNPAEEGIFAMRLKLPAGYRIPPHTHPQTERVTVLSGTFKLGTGSTFDEEAMETLPAGSFFVMPTGMQHFAGTADEETIIQLNSIGPFGITYVNPADDPRRR